MLQHPFLPTAGFGIKHVQTLVKDILKTLEWITFYMLFLMVNMGIKYHNGAQMQNCKTIHTLVSAATLSKYFFISDVGSIKYILEMTI